MTATVTHSSGKTLELCAKLNTTCQTNTQAKVVNLTHEQFCKASNCAQNGCKKNTLISAMGGEQKEAAKNRGAIFDAMKDAGQINLGGTVDPGTTADRAQGTCKMISEMKDYEVAFFARLVSYDAEQKFINGGKLPKGALFHGWEGVGETKFDYYQQEVFPPNGMRKTDYAENFISKFAGDPNSALGDPNKKGVYAKFSSFWTWDNKLVGQVGGIHDIDIWGPDNGSVAVTEMKLNGVTSRVRFSTMNMSGLDENISESTKHTSPFAPFRHPITGRHLAGYTGQHVVGGNREWGFREEGEKLYLYTAGQSKNISALNNAGEPMVSAFGKVQSYNPIPNLIGAKGTAWDSNGFQNANWFAMFKQAEEIGAVSGTGSYSNYSLYKNPVSTEPIPKVDF